ncbi:MAG: alkaline phosphatase family protein [Clostridia bacterium]|nr:alkaline phosphatase family protein [Clostridia bacterium]
MSMNLIWPDYDNCIANATNSILKYWGCEPVGKTLPMLDKRLNKEYKNVVFILLDGMGKAIIEKHLKENGLFRSNLEGIYNSTFLSTTVAATTSALSGLQPCEHCWLGWESYYPQIDKNVVVFLNTIQGTEEPAADYKVAWKYTPYENAAEKINKAGGKAHIVAPFLPPFYSDFDSICSRVKELCDEPERKYIYAYWSEPDGLLHRNGTNAEIVHKTIVELEQKVSELTQELEDTLIIVTADHGHIDNKCAVLQDYPKICDCLVRLPALEPRVLNLFVKEDKKQIFEKEFNKEFGDKFLLITMEEALERKLFGTGKEHECFRGMLGDYLAIATDDLSIYYTDEVWVSMHGSVTEDEVLIPLIVIDTE